MVSGVDLSGDELFNTPDVNINAAIDWDVLTLETGVLTLHADASHRSEASSPPTLFDDYRVVNGRLTFAGDNWSASLWGRNLAEKEYFMIYFDLVDILESRLGFPGPPRTYGAEFTYRF